MTNFRVLTFQMFKINWQLNRKYSWFIHFSLPSHYSNKQELLNTWAQHTPLQLKKENINTNTVKGREKWKKKEGRKKHWRKLVKNRVYMYCNKWICYVHNTWTWYSTIFLLLLQLASSALSFSSCYVLCVLLLLFYSFYLRRKNVLIL